MDHQFTEKLQQWMNTPDEQKNWDEGAIMLLQLSGNKIMYANVSVNPKGKAEFIKGKLQQYLNFRLQQLTHEQVKEMQQKVDIIVKDTIKPDGDFADFKAGKRADHDTLPDEIKALYAENLDIVHRMREVHLKLRTLSLEDATCPDSERFPFLKELIALDKKLHENWDAYDHFVVGNPVPDNLKAEEVTDAKGDVSPETPADESPESQAEQSEASEGDSATGTQSEAGGQTETVAETVAAPKKAKATKKTAAKKA
ncbi:MAG: hypothetical protein IJ551_09180 [Prevotella sp.]|nr:hypothetical protein [Prevotella sp.]